MSELPAKRRAPGLGRGLSALLGDVAPAGRDAREGTATIAVADIAPDPLQPRRHFDEDALEELAASIRVHGVLQPIVVRPSGDGGYRIVAGERRWRAAQRAQLHQVPVLIREFSESEVLEVALLENIQRADLNPIEEGSAYVRLIQQFGHTQDALGKIVHKSRSHIANLIRLLDLPEAMQRAAAEGQLSMGHARALLGARDPEALGRECIAQGWSVRALERRIQQERQAGSKPNVRGAGAAPAANADIAWLERQLSDLLGLRVAIAHRGGGGAVTLSYATLEQLDMICQRLTGEAI